MKQPKARMDELAEKLHVGDGVVVRHLIEVLHRALVVERLEQRFVDVTRSLIGCAFLATRASRLLASLGLSHDPRPAVPEADPFRPAGVARERAPRPA